MSRVFIPVFLITTSPFSAVAQLTVTFTKIANMNTPIPDGTLNFSQFGDPVISNGRVVFYGGSDPAAQPFEYGLYKYSDGSLQRILDTNTPIPGETSNFLSAYAPAVEGDNVAFVGGEPSNQGIYLYDGEFHLLADDRTRIPGSNAFFDAYVELSLRNGMIDFLALDRHSNYGIYRYAGTLSTLVDQSTPMPGRSENFDRVFRPCLRDGTTVFFGWSPTFWQGIYARTPTTLSKIADLADAIPAGNGNFTQFTDPSVSGGRVAFKAFGSAGQQGIYLSEQGVLKMLANKNTTVPGTALNFTGFGPEDVAIDGKDVVFTGTAESIGYPKGIYLTTGRYIARIASLNTVLDGQTLNSIFMDGEGFSGNQVAFRVEYISRNQWAIYLATFQIADDDGDGVWNQDDLCANTIPNVTVDDFGCPPLISGDFNRDGDVDAQDFDAWNACVSGPSIPLGPGCQQFNLDADNDVDQSDFGILQKCFSGENVPGDPGCFP